MTWVLKVGDGEVSSDDFLLADMETIEAESGEFWSTANPARSAKAARAFLRAAYRHADLDPDEVDGLRMAVLKSMFEYRPDEAEPEPDGERPTKPRNRGRTSRSSSPGAPTVTGGPQLQPVNSA